MLFGERRADASRQQRAAEKARARLQESPARHARIHSLFKNFVFHDAQSSQRYFLQRTAGFTAGSDRSGGKAFIKCQLGRAFLPPRNSLRTNSVNVTFVEGVK